MLVEDVIFRENNFSDFSVHKLQFFNDEFKVEVLNEQDEAFIWEFYFISVDLF